MELGFSLVEQTKIVTAASELARNTVIYGGGGEMRIERLHEGPKRAGLRLTFEDHGPGIPDIDLALRDGYTTGNGLGLGLNGARKLSHEFDIKSQARRGHARHDHALEVTCRASSITESSEIAQARRAVGDAGGAPGLRRRGCRARRAGRDGNLQQPGQARRRRRVDRATAGARRRSRRRAASGSTRARASPTWPSACATDSRPAAAPAPGSARSTACRSCSISIRSPGSGTAVLAQLWPERPRRRTWQRLEIGAIVVPKPGEVECGDTWCYVERAGGALVMGVDGLGHGLGAAQAATAGVRRFHDREDARAGARSCSASTRTCARRAARPPS